MNTTLRPRARSTKPAPEPTDARVDRLEDTTAHFYNVINELHERVSTLEKKLDRLHQ